MMEHLPIEPVDDTGSFIFAENISFKTSMIFYSQFETCFLLNISTKTQFCLELFARCVRIKKKGILVSNRQRKQILESIFGGNHNG